MKRLRIDKEVMVFLFILGKCTIAKERIKEQNSRKGRMSKDVYAKSTRKQLEELCADHSLFSAGKKR